MLSGVFGDELFSTGWAWHRENQVVQGRKPVLRADAARIAISLGPTSLRHWFLRERGRRTNRDLQRPRPPWMRAEAFEAVVAADAAASARESLSFRGSVRRTLWPLRSRVVGNRSMHTLADDYDVVYSAPFAHPRFVAALTTERGWRMFPDRTAGVRWLVGDLLPDELPSRTTKAWFDSAFFNRHARDFAAAWSGRGVDSTYVDPEELRRGWLEHDEPDARTYLLLQRAWLADNPADSAGAKAC